MAEPIDQWSRMGDILSWQFLSDSEKQALREEMRDAAAGMDDLLQREQEGEWPSRQPS